MNHCTTVVGLDVHKETIAVAVLPAHADQVTETSNMPNQPAAIERMVARLTAQGPADFVYEAGPCGFEVQRQIAGLGHKCVVVAPGLTPSRPTDRVKTDFRDARKLARLHRAGELTEIHIPDGREEAARDLTRVREDALGDRLRARNRISMFLLRNGRVFRARRKHWGVEHRSWLRAIVFEQPFQQQSFEAYLRAVEEAEARISTLDQQIEDLAQTEPYRTPVRYLRCLKGIDTLSAVTLVAEARDFRRFPSAPGFMSFTGLVCSEYSSGARVVRGAITKAGNAHIRRILGEAAWAYRYSKSISPFVMKRREGCPREIVSISEKADRRLSRKFARLLARNKPHQVAVIAVARELAGFVWAVAQRFPAQAGA